MWPGHWGQPLAGQARERTPGAGPDGGGSSLDGQSGRLAPRLHRQAGCERSATRGGDRTTIRISQARLGSINREKRPGMTY